MTWHPILYTVAAYEIARDGRVRQTPRIDRPGPKPRNADGCMAVIRNGRVYPRVSILIAGRHRLVGVHTLWLTTFVGERPTPRHRAMALDGDYSNLNRHNIRWLTPLEASDLAIRLGRHPQRQARTRGIAREYFCKRCKRWKATERFYRFKVKRSHRTQYTTPCKSCMIVIKRLRERGTEFPARPLIDQAMAILAPSGDYPRRRKRAWIAQQLLEMRKANKLTRVGLSQASGVPLRTLQNVEAGRCVPRVRTLKKIMCALKKV